MACYNAEDNNAEYLSECSDSESCTSSCCESDDDYEPSWIDKVESSGSLFYVEHGMLSTDQQNKECEAKAESKSVFSSFSRKVPSKLKPNNKLKKWLKHRKKQKQSFFPLRSSVKSEHDSESQLFIDPALYYNIKDVYIYAEIPTQNVGYRITPIEEILGLILGSEKELNSNRYQDKVKLLGFLRNVEDFKNSGVKTGDLLKAINDIDVTPQNIGELVGRIQLPSQVKLSFYSAKDDQCSQINTNHNHHLTVEQLLCDSKTLEDAKHQYSHIPHGVFYLAIAENETEKIEVYYKYPDEDTPLLQQKCTLIALHNMVSNIMSPTVLSCTLIVNGEPVYVGFFREDGEIMTVIMPSSIVSLTEVQHFTSDIAKLLKFQYENLGIAFKSSKNVGNINRLFRLFFYNYFVIKDKTNANISPCNIMDILPSVQWFPLPSDLKTEIDDILSELESSDFECSSKGFHGNQRIYNILGSCLFYKAYLLTSHLPKSDLIDIHLYLRYHHLTDLTRSHSVDQVIIWKEVFPKKGKKSLYYMAENDFEETEGRYFMLAVAMQHTTLAVILEAGGCAERVDGLVTPEPFYVEEVQNTLIILEDSGIIDIIEKTICIPLAPLAFPDNFVGEENSSRTSLSSLFVNSTIPSVTVSTHHCNSTQYHKEDKDYSADKWDEAEIERQQLLSVMGPADGESDEESICSDTSSENVSCHSKRYRSHSISTSSTNESLGSNDCLNYPVQMSKNTSSSTSELNTSNENTINVTVGRKNTLFHYLHMDPVEGIFLAPVDMQYDICQGVLYEEILSSFQHSCLKMRPIFERTLRNEEISKKEIPTKLGVNSFLHAAYEQGVLFHCTTKDPSKQKESSTLNFWVIGRIFFTPEPREVYVCYHDSAQQDIVEMAFRLGFGLSL